MRLWSSLNSCHGKEGKNENEFVFTSVLCGLTCHVLVDTVRQAHSLAMKNGLVCFVFVANALVTMYVKCGSLEDSLSTFELSGNKNLITCRLWLLVLHRVGILIRL